MQCRYWNYLQMSPFANQKVFILYSLLYPCLFMCTEWYPTSSTTSVLNCLIIMLTEHYMRPSHQRMLVLSQASARAIFVKWHRDHLLCPHLLYICIYISLSMEKIGIELGITFTVSAQKGSFAVRRPATCRGVTCAKLTLWHSTLRWTLTSPLQTGRWKCSGQCSFCSHLCDPHLQESWDGNNTLMGAYQGMTMVISDFKSLKHIGCVGAAEGPASHNLTKRAN